MFLFSFPYKHSICDKTEFNTDIFINLAYSVWYTLEIQRFLYNTFHKNIAVFHLIIWTIFRRFAGYALNCRCIFIIFSWSSWSLILLFSIFFFQSWSWIHFWLVEDSINFKIVFFNMIIFSECGILAAIYIQRYDFIF